MKGSRVCDPRACSREMGTVCMRGWVPSEPRVGKGCVSGCACGGRGAVGLGT